MNSEFSATNDPVPVEREPFPGEPVSTRREVRPQQSAKSRVATVALVCLFLFAGVFTAFAAGMVVERTLLDNNASASTSSAPQSFDRAWDLVHSQYVDQTAINDDQMLEAAIDGMLGTLHDEGHTRYLTADEAKAENEELSGAYVGVGIQVDTRDDRIVVVAPIDNSPAKEAGVLPGDVLLSVDGKDVTGMTVDNVIDLIRGQEGTQVTLAFQRGDDQTPVSFTLTRRKIAVSSVSWTMLDGDIAVIRLSQFSTGAGDDVSQALKEAQDQGAKGVILDLRNNPGGYINEALQIGSIFVPEGKTIFVSQVRDGTQTPHLSTAQPVTIGDLPLVVLINQGSASSSEIVAGAIKSNSPNATLIGETTFGTGTVLSSYDLGDGSSLLLGTELWLTPEGKLIKNQGITPDVVVGLPSDQVPFVPVDGVVPDASTINDYQLNWALGILHNGSAGTSQPSVYSAPGRGY